MRQLFISLLLLLDSTASAQHLWDMQHLEQVRSQLNTPFYQKHFVRLKAEADTLLNAAPLSVMQKPQPPVSGDRHDYLSMARYFWPNPDTPDGLPYVNRDGESNPEILLYDRERLGRTAQRVITLSLVYYLSRDERYAEKAVQLLRTWFLDKSTRMNPNLSYAQIVRGQNGDRGRCYGVLDAYSLVEMLDGVQLLESSPAFSRRDQRDLRAWFRQLACWMQTSQQGIDESRAANNHGTAYDVQLAAFALYGGDEATARRVVSEFADRRMVPQIADDGSQPHELTRTLAFGYSEYNLSHMLDMAQLARGMGLTIGRRYELGLRFLVPYIGHRDRWPYQQISQWDEKEQALREDVYRASLIENGELRMENYDYQTSADSSHEGNHNSPFSIFNSQFNLLYSRPDTLDQRMAHVERQLGYAVHSADSALRVPANAARRQFAPRSVNTDGTLRLVDAHDWCSGFFAGELWLMYEYSGDERWRRTAISHTWPVEEAKTQTWSHDLGFMINNSFGHAYRLTGERSYRDVVVEAARTLVGRFSPTVGCIRSWDFNRDRWLYPVIIDNMMNLEMLFEATRLTGDSTFWHVAVSHANTTMRHHFRQDASSFHVVDYDPATGDVRWRGTFQGAADDSWWSRGQGWGLYGFTMCYRYTRDERYLSHARRIADFILGWSLPADGVPYWDMNIPAAATPDSQAAPTPSPDTPRDASAAAVIASALYELSGYVSAADAARYRQHADALLTALTAHCLTPTGTAYGFLLQHSTGHLPGGSEIDTPLSYADYYYMEALLRSRR